MGIFYFVINYSYLLSTYSVPNTVSFLQASFNLIITRMVVSSFYRCWNRDPRRWNSLSNITHLTSKSPELKTIPPIAKSSSISPIAPANLIIINVHWKDRCSSCPDTWCSHFKTCHNFSDTVPSIGGFYATAAWVWMALGLFQMIE